MSFDAPNGKRWTDRQTLTLDTYLGLTHIERKGLHEIATTLADVKREIKGWSASGGGVRVANDADIQARFARFMQQDEEPEAPGDDKTDDGGESRVVGDTNEGRVQPGPRCRSRLRRSQNGYTAASARRQRLRRGGRSEPRIRAVC